MNIAPMKAKVHSPSPHDTAGGRASRVIAITSGKGGVGKTNVTSNLAVALAKQGNRVCIFDADTSLANINVIMGVTPRHTVEHLLNGERGVEEILLEGPEGVMIVPAASGIADLASLDGAARDRLIGALRTLEESFDYLLIDTAAGIGESVLCFVHSAQHTILVISTEPTSLTDAFALLRVLKRQEYQRPAYVLVNMALNYANSMEVYKRFEAAVRKYLGMKVHYLGYITDDKALKTSVTQQRPVLLNDPNALASRCFTTLAAVLSKQLNGQTPEHSFSAYWSELADSIAMPAVAISPVISMVPAEPPPAPRGEALAEQESTTAEPAIAPRRESASIAGDLDALANELERALASPMADADTLGRFTGILFERYVTRFRRLPLTAEALADLVGETAYGDDEIDVLITALKEQLEKRFGIGADDGAAKAEAAAAAEARAATQEKHERMLQEYRAVLARLTEQELILTRSLQRLQEYIEDELGTDESAAGTAARSTTDRRDEPADYDIDPGLPFAEDPDYWR